MRTLRSVLILIQFVLIGSLSAHAEGSRRFIYVNNGFTPSLNSEVHDQDIQSFDRDLFGGQTIILNAAGPNAQVVLTDSNGDPLLKTDGSFRMAPSIYPGRAQASLANFKKELSAAARAQTAEMTIVYGGHGGTRGFPFWGAEYMGGKDLRDVFSEIPQSTVIRSLHLHCYAGRAMIDNKRVVATDFAQWGAYLDVHYPVNRCALGLGNDEELGQYLGLAQKWPDTEWSRLFRSMPHPTLQDLQTRLTALQKFMPLPKLTTDYLVDDVLANVCHFRDPKAASANDPAICRDTSVRAFARAEDATTTADDLYFEYRVFKQTWAKDQIWERDTDLYISYQASLGRVDDIRASYAGRTLTEAEKKEMDARIQAELGDKPDRWDKMFMEFAEGMHPDYVRYLSQCDFKCIQEKIEDLPQMNAHPEIVFPAGKTNLLDLEGRLFNNLRKTQYSRKAFADAARARVRQFIESELVSLDPRWAAAVERFKSLRGCETAPIN